MTYNLEQREYLSTRYGLVVLKLQVKFVQPKRNVANGRLASSIFVCRGVWAGVMTGSEQLRLLSQKYLFKKNSKVSIL